MNEKPTLGTWLSIGSPVIAELAALCGLDWVLIDLEHGCGSAADVAAQLRALRGGPTRGIVRVPGDWHDLVARVLDDGERAAAIAQVDGVDVLFVGPADLQHDLAVRQSAAGTGFEECLERVVPAARAAGKAVGILLREPGDLEPRQSSPWAFVKPSAPSIRSSRSMWHTSCVSLIFRDRASASSNRIGSPLRVMNRQRCWHTQSMLGLPSG